jgi:hypothetical protein
MIHPDNASIFKVESDPIKIADLKHQLYYQINRQLKSIHPTTKHLDVSSRHESILHILQKELSEQGYNCFLFVDQTDKDSPTKLRLLIKD